MKLALALLLLLHLCCSTSFGASKQKPKSVTTLINAKWEVTPLIFEVSEFLAEENPAYLWEFIENINSLTVPLVDLPTDKARYDALIREAGFLITPAQLSIMKLALSLHIYSPKVEMYDQMATERGLKRLGCPAAADVAGKLTCDASKLEKLLSESFEPISVDTFSIDHHYPNSENNSITVVLYGELGSPDIVPFHDALKASAKNGAVDYVIRHYVKQRQNRKVRLSGYGVELQIKSTEYKAQDDAQVKDKEEGSEEVEEDEEVEGFNFNRLKTLYPDMKDNLEKMRVELLESNNDMAPLKVWQVQDLSIQAAERIMSSPPEEALRVLTNIAQNFPLQAKSLVLTQVSAELKKEMKQNQEKFMSALNLQPADTALFINGMFFDLDVVDVITLLEVLRQELRVMEGLHKHGISEPLLSSLLALDLTSPSSSDYAVDFRDSAVAWINDIEVDKQYRRWSNSMMELLRPTFPGMLRSVRRNLYNLVVLADPASKEARPLLKMLESFYVHTAPLRLGLVFDVQASKTGLQDAGVALLNCYNYISESPVGNAYAGLSFITDVYAAVKEDRDITVDDVKQALKEKYPQAEVDEVLGEESEFDTGRQLARDFIERTGLHNTPQALLNGIPLAATQLTADDFEEAVLQEIMNQTPLLQKAVYRGELSDADNTVDYLMSQANVMPRLNERVLNTGKSRQLDLSSLSASWLRYLSARKPGSNVPHVITHWVAADLDTEGGRKLYRAALEQMRSSDGIRVGLLLNPTVPEAPQHLNARVLRALQAGDALQDIAKMLDNDDTTSEEAVDAELLARHVDFCRTVLGLSAGRRAVVTNGRLLGPLDHDEIFTADDFSLLERFTMSSYGDRLLLALREQDEDVESSDTLMRAISLLVARPQGKSRFQVPYKSEEHSVLKLPARSATEPAFHIAVIVDPVSRGAQKVGPILSTLHEVLNANVRVFLNCVDKNSDMPLKSFYRFVLEPELVFTAEGAAAGGPLARFSNLPAAPLLNQNMLVPENWLVESVTSPHDLDNIRMEEVHSIVHSEFELEYLLLEGHCFEATLGNPPRGLQMTLGTEADPVDKDTIVMANLGYFQLKANPGAWVLRLRQGRSADIYDIVSHEGSDTPANSTDIKVLISSFRSNVLKLRVSKKPDKMDADLLSEDNNDAGLWSSITSTFSGKQAEGDEADEKINIFSLASGHLYERFLRIMMLSVLKHTKTPVKFWFLKNYLSPNLKDFLPHMAQRYGFEYELVQYKWPRWLHQQTEKQRIIWGYKILFLDVLFPLDVKKIIFVDADQVVRADLKELQDLDLGGAPYGYTPFCESRPEMDGFRFWKTGYWRNHLQGRRYHISALYVVDLKRFRRIAAGDRLRGQYQALSQDPNSLANLDQDLPNNMIHQVAIKSLPQEWLWCETWCDNATKSRAKTIDLCNNPQTKEAKLSAAVRIVDEWRDYDEEVKSLQRDIEGRHTEEGVDSEPEHQHADAHSTHSEL